ncbi:hypothetical protein AGMMS49992_01770 [Clostridia bacterium]|nr:hypothetical protein AGMMS49992_01770 [Clostridia bacterium]
MKRLSNSEDFVEELDGRGRKRYRYVGRMFDVRWLGGRGAVLPRLWMLAALAAAIFIMIGVLPIPGLDKRIWFMIPYIVSGWPTAMLATDVYKITAYKPPITRMDVQRGAGRLGFDAVFGGICAVVATLGQLVTIVGLLLNHNGIVAHEFILLAFAAADCIIFEGTRRLSRRVGTVEIVDGSGERCEPPLRLDGGAGYKGEGM